MLTEDGRTIKLNLWKKIFIFLRFKDEMTVLLMIFDFNFILLTTYFASQCNPLFSIFLISDLDNTSEAGRMFTFEKNWKVGSIEWCGTFSNAALGHAFLFYNHS